MARKKFTTMLDEDVIYQLKIRAAQEKTTPSKILEQLIREYLQKP